MFDLTPHLPLLYSDGREAAKLFRSLEEGDKSECNIGFCNVQVLL